MLNKRYFVTGTDTEVGKTFISSALLEAAARQGYRALGLKPIAAGATKEETGLENEDAIALRRAGNVDVPYGVTNPICFEPPVAPHIAAQEALADLSVKAVHEALLPGLREATDLTIVEGAGGWFVPLNATETLADIAIALDVPVILVVGLRLGCLNHALLTVAAIQAAGLKLAGWVGNQISSQPMSRQADNIATLQQIITAPCLGIMPFIEESAEIQTRGNLLDLTELL